MIFNIGGILLQELIKEKLDIDDFMKLIKVSKRLEKANNNEKINIVNNKKMKIAILSSFSIQHIVSVLRFMLFQKEINAEIYEGEYNSIASDILNSESYFYKFNPDIVIILPSLNDIKKFPKEFDELGDINILIENTVGFYEMLWDKISHNTSCHILQSNFVIPIERQLGNLECNYLFSKQTFYQLVNLKLIEKRKNNINLVDVDYLASLIGKENWFDENGYFLSKLSFKLNYIGRYVDLFTKQIESLQGKINKCIVLDLDNTLWGGIVGDLGALNININPSDPIGETYLWFQKYLLMLKNRGVILAVCSKNDEAIAKSPFEENDNMLLKLEDFSVFVANWEDKPTNIISIANILNIGLDSVVFFDDNPAEREIVKQSLKDVEVIDVPENSSEYVRVLNKSNVFEWSQLTKEDLQRSTTYTDNTKRKVLEDSIINYDDYLKYLDMWYENLDVNSIVIPRFTQLINKTNQFNLRTIRYTEGEIFQLSENPKYKCIAISLKDKFSDYGIISGAILRKEEENCFIDTWVMSCRVLKRGIEYLMMDKMVLFAKQMDCKFIIGEYIESKKNLLVSDLYRNFGFVKDVNTKNKLGNQYVLDLDDVRIKFEYFINNKKV